jgi:hypothetical protein
MKPYVRGKSMYFREVMNAKFIIDLSFQESCNVLGLKKRTTLMPGEVN